MFFYMIDSLHFDSIPIIFLSLLTLNLVSIKIISIWKPNTPRIWTIPNWMIIIDTGFFIVPNIIKTMGQEEIMVYFILIFITLIVHLIGWIYFILLKWKRNKRLR
ncbi:hypothetical protein SAMN06264849_10590 [Melghirimyces algeriensis]|uniref:Uncharacterized protein n=1 Tax=Melghirimyces algeriensis TaxID=910412 RepID=A0A521D3H2_9BACL|nr:hypothetical protein SAMN06264849_10590 [Melghirimyces algeriensis]